MPHDKPGPLHKSRKLRGQIRTSAFADIADLSPTSYFAADEASMTQAERSKSASNDWEADPWEASDAMADAQLAGFRARAAKTIVWTSVRDADPSPFGIKKQNLIGADVEYFATRDGEDLLLMQLAWHGFPDPPEWRLATRPSDSNDPWTSWGYFAEVPEKWRLPASGS